MRYVVIMAGGSGTRLWPLSRKGTPKQLLKLIGGTSLLRLAFERAIRVVPAERVLVVTGAAYLDAVAEDLPQVPAATAAQAQALVRAGQFDLALLDANLAGEPVEDIAAALQARSIPFAFLSGYGRSELPSGFDSIQLVRKPFTIDQVCQVVRHLARQTDASARRNR